MWLDPGAKLCTVETVSTVQSGNPNRWIIGADALEAALKWVTREERAEKEKLEHQKRQDAFARIHRPVPTPCRKREASFTLASETSDSESEQASFRLASETSDSESEKGLSFAGAGESPR